LVTKVLIEDRRTPDGLPRASGVSYFAKKGLYHATPGEKAALPPASEERTIKVRERGEVILAGGAFNTPQLLMLSGIGPAKQRDDALKEWMNHRGVYATNGVVLTIIKKSRSEGSKKNEGVPDLFIFGVPGYFRGYYKGYSADIQNGMTPDGKKREDKKHNRFTW